MINKKIKEFIFNERSLFYFLLIINILLLFLNRFYPSMDGPAHLYNSNLLNIFFIKGNNVLQDYFQVNSLFIPNWISHFILSSSMTILPAWLAEKFLLSLYFILLALSFRVLVKEIRKTNLILSILIFPFAHSFLFHLGFYNYSLSFIFLFFTIFYYIKTFEQENIIKYFILMFLFVITYLSGVLTFLFLGLILGVIAIVKVYASSKKEKFGLRVLKECIKIAIISLPGLILLFLFNKAIPLNNSGEHLSVNELTSWLFDIRPLIVYNYAHESFLLKFLFLTLIAITSISIYNRYRIKENQNFFEIIKNEYFIIPTLFALVLYYVIPDNSGAGMMSLRYSLMFFMLLIIWIASLSLPASIMKISAFIIVIIHLSLLFRFNQSIKPLSVEAQKIENVSKQIKENCIVLPINFSDNWLGIHFSNYLGINEPMLILENYEANVSWFPLKWNQQALPKFLLGNKQSVNGLNWISNIKSTQIKEIDYVFIYGNKVKLDNPEWQELKAILTNEYVLVSKDQENITLYKIKSL